MTVPLSSGLRPCLGVVLAGLTARAGIGVGGLDEVVNALEKAHAEGGTSYRFAVQEAKIYAQVEYVPDKNARTEPPESSRWRTLAELVS